MFLASRSGFSGPRGKFNIKMRTNVDEQMKRDAECEAHANGLSVSEWNRNLIAVRLYGLESAKSMYSDRVSRVAGNDH